METKINKGAADGSGEFARTAILPPARQKKLLRFEQGRQAYLWCTDRGVMRRDAR